MAVTVFKPEEQNISQAPTLGQGSGTFGANAQQRKNIAQGGSGRFTNLQQYVQANEANNPNAQLLQREATVRQGELGTRQQEFVKQAEPIKSGFQAIRSGQQFVQSALENPTQIVQDPSNIQRFAGYRTGGIGDIETPFNQLQTARGTLGTQQEQLASRLETIQRDPNALQNYLQSQRANPSLATRGENVLDRFLTQSTESGQRALTGLGTTASAIRSTQAPSIIGDIETLRRQAQSEPLRAGEIQNLITTTAKPEEDFLKGINNLYIASKIGIGNKIDPIKASATPNKTINPDTGREEIVFSFEELPKLTYQKPQATTQATEQDINKARKQFNDYTYYTNAIKEKTDTITRLENSIKRLSNQGIDPFDPLNNQLQQAKDSLQKQMDERTNLMLGASNRDYSLVPFYEKYQQLLGSTKQDILKETDPTRLSRIQALQQLAGTNQFNPLLSGGIQ